MAKDSEREGLVKIFFQLVDAPTATESMWAEPLDEGRFRLRNSPFYAFGVSFHDIVYVKEAPDGGLDFAGVAEPAGHSTYRVILEDGVTRAHFEEKFEELRRLGCNYECGTDEFFVIDVPPASDIYAVYRVLEQGETEGLWEFEEAHVGHELRKPMGPYLKYLWKLFREKW